MEVLVSEVELSMHSAKPVPSANARLLKEGDFRCCVCSAATLMLLLLLLVIALEEEGLSNPGGGGVKLVNFGGALLLLLTPPSSSTMDRRFISIWLEVILQRRRMLFLLVSLTFVGSKQIIRGGLVSASCTDGSYAALLF